MEAIGAELAGIEKAKQAETEAEKLRVDGIADAVRLEEELLRLRETAAQTLLQLQRQLRDEAEAGGDPLIRQAQAQRDAIEEASRAAGQAVSPEAQEAAGEVLAALVERRRLTLEQINALTTTNAQLEEQLEARGQRILVSDQARGEVCGWRVDHIPTTSDQGIHILVFQGPCNGRSSLDDSKK